MVEPLLSDTLLAAPVICILFDILWQYLPTYLLRLQMYLVYRAIRISRDNFAYQELRHNCQARHQHYAQLSADVNKRR